MSNSLHQIYGDEMDVDRYLKKIISLSFKLDNGSANNFIKKYEFYEYVQVHHAVLGVGRVAAIGVAAGQLGEFVEGVAGGTDRAWSCPMAGSAP